MGSPLLRAAVILAAGLLTLGCTNSSDQPTTASSPLTSPTPGSVTTAPTPVASAAPTSLPDLLLTSAQMPGLNPQWKWSDGKTGPAGADPFGTCARFSLLDIGATDVVERTYLDTRHSGAGISAAEQLATFPDAATAARAAATLQAWRGNCRAQISKASNIRVGPLTGVRTSTGSGQWYLLSWLPRGAGAEGRFHAFGFQVNGSTMLLLRIDSAGQDYDYPVGQEPMAKALRAAAAKLS